jgi:multimeric flavodoxin WrbA
MDDAQLELDDESTVGVVKLGPPGALLRSGVAGVRSNERKEDAMATSMKRRAFLGAAGAAVAVSVGAKVSAAGGSKDEKRVKFIGISCSPRKGKNTTVAVRACLEAVRDAVPHADVELLELAGLKIPGAVAAGVPLESGERDDFPSLVPKLSDPDVAGIIVGSPVYFGSMSSLCKAFLDRSIAFRKAGFALSNKVAGVLAVGGARNGGQETTVQSIQTALLCQEMIVVGDGRPSARLGAMLWSQEDNVADDEVGLGTARNLGRRVAEVAMRSRGTEE